MDKADDSKRSWPVKAGLNGINDPHWEKIRVAKEGIDNGREALPKKKGK
jgi:hypothetical protein